MRWHRGQRPHYKTLPLLERIQNKVWVNPRTGCWIWRGAYSQKTGRWKAGQTPDRPVIQLGGRGSPVVHVLRITLSLKDGVPLDDRAGIKACHTCDNFRCVNPDHGYWGTDQQNSDDRMARQPETFWTRVFRRRMARQQP